MVRPYLAFRRLGGRVVPQNGAPGCLERVPSFEPLQETVRYRASGPRAMMPCVESMEVSTRRS